MENSQKKPKGKPFVRIKDSTFDARVGTPEEYRVTVTNAKDIKKELLLSTEADKQTIVVNF